MLRLTKKQAEVLSLMISDWKEHGCPPTQSRLDRLMGAGDPWGMLQRLQDKGFVRQAYAEGPWVPLRDVDGVPLKWEVARSNQAA